MAKKTAKILDWLALQIIYILEDQGFDAAYIEDTQATLAGKDRFAVLLWCNNLDSERQASLAKRLTISPDDLATTLRTVQKM